jgi:hypothetical protein
MICDFQTIGERECGVMDPILHCSHTPVADFTKLGDS